MENEDLLVRKLVLDILLTIEKEGEMSHIVMKNVLDKYNYLDGKKKALIKRMAQGTIERKIQIDYIINQFSKTPVKKMKPVIRCIMEMSVYQILFMDFVFDTQACNMAVNLAKKRGFTNLSGFVNGVLRSIVRGRDEIVYPKKEEGFISYASIKYSIPEWIVELISKQYGEEACEKILENSLEEGKVTIRIRECAMNQRDELISKWKKEGVDVHKAGAFDYAYKLGRTNDLSLLPGFEEGFFTVQDISSMCVAGLAGIKETDRVLDLCAAPGGKSMHAAEFAVNGKVTSCDVSDYKVERIRENIERLGYENINCIVNDATVLKEKWVDKFDVVIADVPCSGLGVIGKKPDMKYRLSKEGLDEIVHLQREILLKAAAYVKPGGVLIYSTCTINKDENQKNIKWFIEEGQTDTGKFTVEGIPSVPSVFQSGIGPDKTLQLLQGINESDGFYIARLRKSK